MKIMNTTMKCSGSVRILRDVVTSAILLTVCKASSQTVYTWNKTASGTYNWNAAANWTPNSGFPNAAGCTANLTNNIAGVVSNALGQTVTVGVLNLGDADGTHPYIITSTSAEPSLVFNNDGDVAQLNQTSTTKGDTIAASLWLAGSLNINLAASGKTLTLGGTIETDPAAENSLIAVSGVGTLALTGSNVLEGGIALRSGILNATARGDGSVLSGSSCPIEIGGDNPATANGNASLILSGTTAATTNHVGALTASGSFNSGTLTLNAAAGGLTVLQGGILSQNPGATLVVSPRNTTSLGLSERLFLNGGTSLSSGILPPWLVVSGNSGDFASYGESGVGRAGYADNAFDAAKTDQVVNLTTNTTLSSPQTAYASRLSANLDLAGNSLTVGNGTMGGLILANGKSIASTIAGAQLDIGTGNLLVYTEGANVGTISVPITGTGVLRKFGTGTLVVTNNSAYAGGYAVQAGTLTLRPGTDAVFTNRIYGAGTLSIGPSTGTLTLSNGLAEVNGIILNGGNLTVAPGAVKTLALSLNSGSCLYVDSSSVVTGLTSFSWTGTTGKILLDQGGKLFSNTSVEFGYNADNQTGIVASTRSPTGCGGSWNLGGKNLVVGTPSDWAGTTGSRKLLTIDNVTLTNVGAVYTGSANAGTFNKGFYDTLVLTNHAEMVVKSDLIMGTHGTTSNRVVVTDNAWMTIGSLLVGRDYSLGNEVWVDGEGATLTLNGTTAYIGYPNTGGMTLKDSRLVITNGGQFVHTGASANFQVFKIDTTWAGNNATNNGILVTGPGSLLNGGTSQMNVYVGRVSYGTVSKGKSIANYLTLDDGGAATNLGSLTIGTYGETERNALSVRNGSSLYSGSVTVGGIRDNLYVIDGGETESVVVNSDITIGSVGALSGMSIRHADLRSGMLKVGNSSSNNWVNVGENVRWTLDGATITVGTGAAVGNTLTIGEGAAMLNGGALVVGETTAASGNRLKLSGGHLEANSLRIGSTNVLEAVLSGPVFDAAQITGTATFDRGSLLSLSALKTASHGIYTILTANSVIDNGIALDPAVDPAHWNLLVEAQAIKVQYLSISSIIVVR